MLCCFRSFFLCLYLFFILNHIKLQISNYYDCFQHAKHDEAWMILKHVHDSNWRAKGEPERVFTVRDLLTAQIACLHLCFITQPFHLNKTWTFVFSSQVSQIKTPKTQEDEFFEIQTSTGTPFQRWAVRTLMLIKLVN